MHSPPAELMVTWSYSNSFLLSRYKSGIYLPHITLQRKRMKMYDSDLRMFQINILVPFLEEMELKCACICSWEEMMECWRMAARLASESSVTTSDCNTELRSKYKGACRKLIICQSAPLPFTILISCSHSFNSLIIMMTMVLIDYSNN